MSSDRAKTILDGLTAGVSRRLDYLALYPARVVAQNGDDSLELQPDDQRLPGLSRVPIRHGLPGSRVVVRAGARVLLGFEGGDPQRPFAALWEAGDNVSRTEIRADAVHLGGPNPSQHVALAGDVLDRLTAIAEGLNSLITAYNAHTQGTAMGPTSPPLVPATPIDLPTSVAASKVKAE